MSRTKSAVADVPTRERVLLVQGHQFIFTNSRELPSHGLRIGSVTVDINNSTREYVRIYGYTPSMPERKETYTFEKSMREACADKELLEWLFGSDVTHYQIRSFNPSLTLRARGYGTPPTSK